MAIRQYIVGRDVRVMERVIVNTDVLTPEQIALLDDEAGGDEASRAVAELFAETRWGRIPISEDRADDECLTFDLEEEN